MLRAAQHDKRWNHGVEDTPASQRYSRRKGSGYYGWEERGWND
jgi:hypothetical protein